MPKHVMLEPEKLELDNIVFDTEFEEPVPGEPVSQSLNDYKRMLEGKGNPPEIITGRPINEVLQFFKQFQNTRYS